MKVYYYYDGAAVLYQNNGNLYYYFGDDIKERTYSYLCIPLSCSQFSDLENNLLTLKDAILANGREIIVETYGFGGVLISSASQYINDCDISEEGYYLDYEGE